MTCMTLNVRRELLALHDRLGSWRAVARYIGAYSAGYWCTIAHGTMRPSRRAENALRRRLGLAPRGVARVHEMGDNDLRWYLRNRREVRAEDAAVGW